MVFEHIERLKQEYTDKLVVIDERVPELRRFKGLTGTVKTVNMNGRALVEFDGHNNIGWFDIDIDYLRIIDRPLPKSEASARKEPAQKVVAKAAPATSMTETSKAGKPAAAGMSAAEILAAARKGAAGAEKSAVAKSAPKAAAKPDAKPGAMSVADVLAAARAQKGGEPQPGAAAAAPVGESDQKATLQHRMEAARQRKPAAPSPPSKPAAAPSQKLDPKRMTVEQMLAAARAEKSGAGAPPPAEPALQIPAEVAATVESARPQQPTSAPSRGGRRNDITDVAAQLAYCRQVDGA
jgi:hypothetical protein